MIIVGITGGLGSGKTTVAEMFARKGAKVISADLLAKQAVQPSAPCFTKVVRRFGPGILKAGQINRVALAEIVFRDERQLRDLEKLIHPFVKQETRRILRELKNRGCKIVVLEVPLLFESGMSRWTDFNIVVKAGLKIRMGRVESSSKMTREHALRRTRSQMPFKDAVALADVVINNGGSRAATQKQVDKIWDALMKRYL